MCWDVLATKIDTRIWCICPRKSLSRSAERPSGSRVAGRSAASPKIRRLTLALRRQANINYPQSRGKLRAMRYRQYHRTVTPQALGNVPTLFRPFWLLAAGGLLSACVSYSSAPLDASKILLQKQSAEIDPTAIRNELARLAPAVDWDGHRLDSLTLLAAALTSGRYVKKFVAHHPGHYLLSRKSQSRAN